MARPFRRLSVTPETRRKWLQRHDENGESPPQIAARDGYDVRTVRRQIELARQERETRETRMMVLRGAAESHYHDLCMLAERLDSAISRDEPVDYFASERMYSAMRQHLPRSPLWPLFEEWNNAKQNLEKTRSDFRVELNSQLSKDKRLASAFAGGKKDMMGLIELFTVQSAFWSQGNPGLDIEQSFTAEPAGNGLANYRVSGYGIGTGPESQAPAIVKALTKFKERLSDFENYQNLQQQVKELRELKLDIQEELATIILRRVLPGRCKYCPV
jgi:hypothetical protein